MKVAVCICTCDRPAMLGRLLAALRGIELGESAAPVELEVVVVDNAADAGAREVCARAAEGHRLPIHYAHERRSGIAVARNRAVSEALARGADFVAFVDDDDVPEADWLTALLDVQRASDADIVCGTWRWQIARDAPEMLRMAPMFKKRDLAKRKRGIPAWMATCNVLIGRRVLEDAASAGPVFSPEFDGLGSEDTDFFIRSRQRGAVIEVAAGSVVNRYYEPQRLTTRGMLRYAFRRGNAAVYLTRKHDPPAGLRRARAKALRKLGVNLLTLPAGAFSKRQLARRLYWTSYGLGMLYGFTGRQFGYYR